MIEEIAGAMLGVTVLEDEDTMRKCGRCGGALEAGKAEEQIRVGAWWFHTIVPVEVCAACGETYVSAAVGLAMEEQVAR